MIKIVDWDVKPQHKQNFVMIEFSLGFMAKIS